MNRDDTSRLSALLGLLGDPVRTAVLLALDTDSDLSVAEVAALARSSAGDAEDALRVLAAAGVVSCDGPPGSVRGRLAVGFPLPLLRECLPRLIELTRRADPA
jgi:hypothetical protein